MTWPVPEAWLAATLADSHATPVGDGSLEIEFSKQGREVLVRGKARAEVTVPCVVTLDPLPFTLEPEIYLLLSPAPVVRPKEPKAPKAGAEGPATAAVEGKKLGTHAKSAPAKKKSTWSDDPELLAADAARDTFDGEKVVMDEFLREFLVLELPPFPRRSDLPSVESPAIAPPSAADPNSVPAIDPRLMPLAAIADRLREQQKKE